MTAEQNADMESVCGKIKGFGVLDFVTAWYVKAAAYIQGARIACAFVSTNSISQGEQPTVLWSHLFRQKIKIHFAHRTFVWANEASGKAHVHVVVIGFGNFDCEGKRIFDKDPATDLPVVIPAKNISPYLIEGPDKAITNLSKPLCPVPELGIGNKPIDDGNYLFTPDEKRAFVAVEPQSAPHFRQWLGAEEFINGIERWCLWLGDVPPDELRRLPECLKRVEAVRKSRLASKSTPTQKLAATPTRFHVEFMPQGNYLAIPEVSSERRKYIPIGFLGPHVLSSNKLRILDNATPWHFGILTSGMHMAWTNVVTGRLESRYQYSVKLVYNNFPWPDPDAKQRAAVESAAQAVLDARAPHLSTGATLADLYDPLTMPPELTKAHQTLDRAVDRCYRKEPFTTDRERVEFLFALYEKLTDPLLPANRKPASYKGIKKKSPRPDPHMGLQAATDADDGHMDTVMEEPGAYTAK